MVQKTPQRNAVIPVRHENTDTKEKTANSASPFAGEKKPSKTSATKEKNNPYSTPNAGA